MRDIKEVEVLDEIYATKQDAIHRKGFDLFNFYAPDPDDPTEYGKKIKLGVKQLEDAVLELGTLSLTKAPFCSKRHIMRALALCDYRQLREISDFFYRASGIYQTVCNYFAFLYRYDWYLYPENVKDSANRETVIRDYTNMLSYFDNSHIKKLCGEIALKVVKYGCYYGYLVDSNKSIVL